MNSIRKLLACSLAAAMVLGMTACDDEVPSQQGNNAGGVAPGQTSSTQASTTTDPNDNAATDQEAKDIDTSVYTPDGNAGTIRHFGIYDITTDQKGKEQYLIFQTDTYGGNIEVTLSPSGTAYYEKLATLVATDDSPDTVVYDALFFPNMMSKNTFTPLDEYIDYNTPLWEEMAPFIEDFAYRGNHYFYPHRLTTSFALNYSQKTIEENNLPDPYEMYKSGDWTWDAWRSLMIQFCDIDDDNIGFYGTDTTTEAFIITTGTPLVDVHADGSIDNNLISPDVTRAMSFLSELFRDGVMYAKQLGDWVPPQTFAVECDRLLFLGMEPEWTYIAATEQLQNPSGVENDIFDTPSEFRFVPFPRDPSSDTYYQGYDLFGYLVPRGAKNVKGAIDWINCNRVFDMDENIIAQIKKDHVAPEPIYYTAGSYEGQRRWQITWDEDMYDLWREMCDPAKFTFVHEDIFGLSQDVNTQLASALTGPPFNGESWPQLSAEINPVIEATADEFRS